MRSGTAVLLVWLVAAAAPDESLDKALARVSEEAEVFQTMAPKMLSEETLVQRALEPPRRFRPRAGSAALEPTKPQYRTREIVSEYSFSSLKSAPNVLHEFRQPMTVDGRRLATAEKARERLTEGVRSEDERVKRRMLERFEKLGLRGAVADFGQVLLLFSRRRLGDYEFEWAGTGRIGADTARIARFRQHAGEGALLIFEKRKALHQPLEGVLWVREDGLPLRVVLRTARQEDKTVVRDEATVEYTPTPHGPVMPASVVHREYVGPVLVVENVFRYAPFKMFAADADIKFTEEPAPKQ